jgi:hypothetical protein
MKLSDSGSYALSICVAVTFLSGCGGSQAPISAPGAMPQSLAIAAQAAHGTSWIKPGTSHVTPPRTPGDKLYIGVGSGSYSEVVNGYRLRHGHLKQICTIPGITQAANVSVDAQGRPLVPGGVAKSVTVFSGPGLCGSELGSLTDSYGQPIDASSANAATGIIAVANIFDTGSAGDTLKPGSISVCTLSGGCTANLTNPNMFELGGVLLAKNGDCWASALNHSITAGTLTYFKHCSGSGKAATGYKSPGYGSLDIDSQGNLVTVSWTAYSTDLYVYRGCDPRCSLIGGPLPVKNHGIVGRLNASGTTWAMADFPNPTISVYAYTPTKLTYEYTLTVGRGTASAVRLAFSPRSK